MKFGIFVEFAFGHNLFGSERVKMKGNLKCSSSNLLSQSGLVSKKQDTCIYISAASQTLLTEAKLHLQHRLLPCSMAGFVHVGRLGFKRVTV